MIPEHAYEELCSKGEGVLVSTPPSILLKDAMDTASAGGVDLLQDVAAMTILAQRSRLSLEEACMWL